MNILDNLPLQCSNGREIPYCAQSLYRIDAYRLGRAPDPVSDHMDFTGDACTEDRAGAKVQGGGEGFAVPADGARVNAVL